jgi:hypothetical protein
MTAISFVIIVFAGLVFSHCTSAFFDSSMPTYNHETSFAVDGGNSNSWIMQETSFQDEVLKNFNVEHWLVFFILHTPDNTSYLSLAGWLDSHGQSAMLLKMDDNQYAFNFAGKQFQFENDEPYNVTIAQGDVEIVVHPNEERIITVHTNYGTYSFTSFSRGLPLWLARNEDEMIICTKNSVTGYPYYIGGFGDLITVSGTVQDKYFEGYGVYVHWWTNEFVMQDWASLFMNQEDFYLMTWQSWNKTNPAIEYLSTGFLGFPNKNQYYSFDNFTFISRGSSEYTIIGNYEKGFININGKKIGELMNNNQTGLYIHWDGTLTFNEEEIAVNAEGSGEIAGERQDTIPPSIGNLSQNPESTAVEPYQDVNVTADVVDQISGVSEVLLSYSTNEGGTWTNITMNRISGNTYSEKIPGFGAGTNVQYKIIAYDYANNFAVEDKTGQYYIYNVIPEFNVQTILIIAVAMLLVTIFLKVSQRSSSHQKLTSRPASMFNNAKRFSRLQV